MAVTRRAPALCLPRAGSGPLRLCHERDTPLSLDAEAALIEPLIDAFTGPVYLVGHDYGAAVALKLAQRRRERIAGLVLYEPAAFGLLLADPTSRYDTLEIVVLRRVLGPYLDAGDWFRAALRYVDHWSGADAWERLSTPQRATIASRMPELCARLDAALADPMPLSGYAGIDVPVLLLTECSDARLRRAQRPAPRAHAAARGVAPDRWRGPQGPRLAPGGSRARDRRFPRATPGELVPRSGADRLLRVAGICVPPPRNPATGSGRGRTGTDRHRAFLVRAP